MKKTNPLKIIFYALSLAMLFNACKKEDQHLPPNFNYPIEEVPITENVNVGAYYSSYSAADWARKYSSTPEQGQYSSLSAPAMDQNRKWADLGRIDFFIFNWNGSAAGDPLLNSFINGRTSNVKMVINYNIAHLSATNASPLAGAKLTTMINELKDLANSHFSKDYYFKVNAQPVILITPLNQAANAATSVDFSVVMPALKQAMDPLGIKLYVIGEITSGWLPPQRYSAAVKAFDGVNLSNWSTGNYDQSVFFPAYADQNLKNWSDSTTTWKLDLVPCIFPGFNDKVMTPASKLYNIGGTADFYKGYCNVAKRNMGSKRIVLINSWNNFQFGTSLEPAKEYGTTYLEITKSQFKVK